jgi:mono/diheme cytochrome c family protein
VTRAKAPSKRPVLLAIATAAMAFSAAPNVLADGTGWFSQEQISQGRWEYGQKCAVCHGAQLQGGGAPALKGQAFVQLWSGKSLKNLYDYVHDQMPLT